MDKLPKDLQMRKNSVEKQIHEYEEILKEIANKQKELKDRKQINEKEMDKVEASMKKKALEIDDNIHGLKLKQNDLETELLRIKGQIETKEKIKAFQREDIENKRESKEMLESHIEKSMEIEINHLKTHPGYKTKYQMKLLRDEYETLKVVPDESEDNDPETETKNAFDCPICLEKPNQCYGCQKCDNWVCDKCQSQLTSCPQCREDLESNPLKRNKHLERVIIIKSMGFCKLFEN